MPVLYCKNCAWGMIGLEGVSCTNPGLESVQKGNVMPMNARSCPLYKAVPKKKED